MFYRGQQTKAFIALPARQMKSSIHEIMVMHSASIRQKQP
ncbi:hypothetical protein CHUV0807_0644 [Cardiobacterium hominis]|uniref:Uncharacterized protein n=1 Tax=Cardiobacterium hominis TaxID=2718 RepID=A0A1C3HP08_9GAMM|nr:hypothetical protein CHUV0807_0644 [Cardiobacterium hominis]